MRSILVSQLVVHVAKRGRCHFSLYNRDRLPIIRSKKCHQHPFEGAKLQMKISSLVSRRSSCFGEELKDWTRLMLSCAAHRYSSFTTVLHQLPERIQQQKIVYEIHLCLLGHQFRYWKRLGAPTPSLRTADDVFHSISTKCNGAMPGFSSYFLYMDAYCSARNLEIPWKMYRIMPKPTADDFIHLITLYDALGESVRCRSLVRCIQHLKLKMGTTAAMKLAAFFARTMPDVPSRKDIVESLVYAHIRPGIKQLYGHAAQGLLLTSHQPGPLFDTLIQTSTFTVAVLLKRLIALRRFEELADRIKSFKQMVLKLGYHDHSVIVTGLGQAKQFDLALQLIHEKPCSVQVLTSLIADASKSNQQGFVRRLLSNWPNSVSIDSICLTAIFGSKLLPLSVCETKARLVSSPDGLLYSRMFYLCTADYQISNIWDGMLSRNVEPDVFVNIAVGRSIANLQGLDPLQKRSLHIALIARAIAHMRNRMLQWPAILDSAIVMAGQFGASDIQHATYRLLREFGMFPTSRSMSEIARLKHNSVLRLITA